MRPTSLFPQKLQLPQPKLHYLHLAHDGPWDDIAWIKVAEVPSLTDPDNQPTDMLLQYVAPPFMRDAAPPFISRNVF